MTLLAALLMYPFLGGGPPRTIHPVNPDAPLRLPDGVTKKVLVIGGGVSGLTTALKLAERGFDVTIKEKELYIGGRFGTQTFRALGKEFHVSHGFHAWFHNYHNFKGILKSLDVEKYYSPWTDNHMAFRDYEWENTYSSGPWPFNLIAIIMRSPNLNPWTAMKAWRVSLDFIYYNHDTVYDMYDNLTYDEWASSCGVVPEFGDIWLKPGISASFNNISLFSAAELLMYSHFFFISSPEAEHRMHSVVDLGTSLINPWAEKLKKLGVKIELGKAMTALQFDAQSGRVTGEVATPAVKYDHAVLAVDLRSTKKIISQSQKLSRDNQRAAAALSRIGGMLDHLPMAQPYKIMKVWFDKNLKEKHHPILQTPQHHPLNVIIQLHQIEEQYRIWSEQSGGSVMEFHMYSWNLGDIADDKLWKTISPTVYEIYPEISDRKFQILTFHVATGNDVASFDRGTAKYRPHSGFPQKHGIPNLNLASDWLQTDYPSALSERSISTGIEAANQILLAEGLRQEPLVVTTSYGPGLI